MAVAALLCLAGSASAGIVDMQLDATKSYMTWTLQQQLQVIPGGIGASFGTQPPSNPQKLNVGSRVPEPTGPAIPFNSNTTLFSGHMLFDMGVNTIQAVNGQRINATTTGNYAPGRNFADQVFSGVQDLGNFGIRYTVTSAANGGAPISSGLERIYGLAFDSKAGNPVRPLTPAGPLLVFTLGNTDLVTIDGGSDYVDPLLSPLVSAAMQKQNLKGTMPNMRLTSAAPTAPGTLDPLTGHLVIPIAAQVVFPSLNGFPTVLVATGQLVFNPTVPEPSSVALLSLGIVGLLGFASRKVMRRRSAASH